MGVRRARTSSKARTAHRAWRVGSLPSPSRVRRSQSSRARTDRSPKTRKTGMVAAAGGSQWFRSSAVVSA
eukprot:2256999-Alexandrium_andersonii.AAC.1